jgi:hypothetical protein
MFVGIIGGLNMVRSVSETASSIHGLADVVTRDPLPQSLGFAGLPKASEAEILAIGDSTFAGPGLPPDGSSVISHDCSRSYMSWPWQLGRVNRQWNVLNLSCSGATIQDGLINPQFTRGAWVPAQLDEAQADKHVKVIVVGVGADDVQWTAALGLCAKVPFCKDPLSDSLFKNRLEQLQLDHIDLFSRLAAWPTNPKPKVLVVQYYNPFGADLSCLKGTGLGDRKKLMELSKRVLQLNDEIASSAAAFRFQVVPTDFTAGPICSLRPYVQGPLDKAPFHPTIAGALIQAAQIGEAIEKFYPQLFPVAAGLRS